MYLLRGLFHLARRGIAPPGARVPRPHWVEENGRDDVLRGKVLALGEPLALQPATSTGRPGWATTQVYPEGASSAGNRVSRPHKVML